MGMTWGAAPASDGSGNEPAETYRVELIGTQLRAEGSLSIKAGQRLSDYLNFLEGFCWIEDVVLRAHDGDPTRVVLPEVRISMDDITIVGLTRSRAVPRGPAEPAQPDGPSEPGVRTGPDDPDEPGQHHIEKQAHRIVVMTTAHEIYGYVHLHEQGSVTAFVDATYPRFIPMTNVHVRWLADRRLAGRFDFALLQRSHIIGVATDTGGRDHRTAADVGTGS